MWESKAQFMTFNPGIVPTSKKYAKEMAPKHRITRNLEENNM